MLVFWAMQNDARAGFSGLVAASMPNPTGPGPRGPGPRGPSKNGGGGPYRGPPSPPARPLATPLTMFPTSPY